MSSSKVFIPTKLKVGYQERSDTFTGKLSYIIYYDEKGKLRKEGSWKSWCNASLGDNEFENVPLSGFTMNKGVTRSSEWFGSGRTMIRIHDPRGFEFEITVDNFQQLLMHSDVSKREIQQPCVYGWFGTQLVLLPTNSQEYESSVAFTKKLSLENIKQKDLIVGATYSLKKSDQLLVYLGKFPLYDMDTLHRYCSFNIRKLKGNKPIFVNISQLQSDETLWSKNRNFQNSIVVPSLATLAECVDDTCYPSFANMVEFLTTKTALTHESQNHQPINITHSTDPVKIKQTIYSRHAGSYVDADGAAKVVIPVIISDRDVGFIEISWETVYVYNMEDRYITQVPIGVHSDDLGPYYHVNQPNCTLLGEGVSRIKVAYDFICCLDDAWISTKYSQPVGEFRKVSHSMYQMYHHSASSNFRIGLDNKYHDTEYVRRLETLDSHPVIKNKLENIYKELVAKYATIGDHIGNLLSNSPSEVLTINKSADMAVKTAFWYDVVLPSLIAKFGQFIDMQNSTVTLTNNSLIPLIEWR